MSSGQACWVEEAAEEAHRDHLRSLEEIGYGRIAKVANTAIDLLNRLEHQIDSLPRGGWEILDELKKTLKILG